MDKRIEEWVNNVDCITQKDAIVFGGKSIQVHMVRMHSGVEDIVLKYIGDNDLVHYATLSELQKFLDENEYMCVSRNVGINHRHKVHEDEAGNIHVGCLVDSKDKFKSLIKQLQYGN